MRTRQTGPLFVLPSMVLVVGLLVLPAIYGLYYSLFRIRFLQLTDFIGLGNYARLFSDPNLVPVVLRTLLFTACSVGLTLTLAMALALWIDRLRGLIAFAAQVIIILPWVISAVVASLLFRWVFVSDIGVGRYLLNLVGLNFDPLANATSAMVLLILVSSWRTVGYGLVLLLAGLKGIPSEYYEAARVDGASSGQIFRLITLPLLKTPLLIATVVLTLSYMNNVETPLVTTAGGPGQATNILPLDLYSRAFAQYDFATAIPLAICMFIANIFLVLGYVRLVGWRV